MVLADVHCMETTYVHTKIFQFIYMNHYDMVTVFYSQSPITTTAMMYSNITLTSHSIIINKEEGVAANDKKIPMEHNEHFLMHHIFLKKISTKFFLKFIKMP